MVKWVVIGGFLLVAFLGLIFAMMGIGYSNTEVRLRNTINAKIEDNKSEFDNMWKKISQVVQVTKKERESLEKIIIEHAQARKSNGDNLIMAWVQESVPTIDNKTFVNLQNIIIGSRDSWTMRQKELIDLKREHDNIRMLFPSSLIVGSRPEIKITIITSDKTDTTFKSGKDNDVDLFGEKK